MFISDELKSKGFVQRSNLAAVYGAETNSAVLYDIYAGANYGIDDNAAAWIQRHFGLRYFDMGERRTIIRIEDFTGARVPRAAIDRYYGYIADGDKLYQMTAYLNESGREELKLPALDEEYKVRRALMVVKRGVISNYHTAVRLIDVPRMRVINDYCKQVNKYLRVAAAMAHLNCRFESSFTGDIYRTVAKCLQERVSPQEAAFRVIEALGDNLVRMPLARAHEVFYSAFSAPAMQMEHLYVRE
jgi:hypothetical protein